MVLPAPKDAEGAPGLIVWLGSGKQESQEQVLKDWQEFCRTTNCILMIASPEAKSIWSSSDEPYLQKLASALQARLGTDRRRTVVAGHGKAGQLALGLAFAKRSSFAGVVAVDAPLPRTLKIPTNVPGVQLSVLAVESSNSAFAPLIRRDVTALREARYPVTWLQRPPEVDPQSRLKAATRRQIQRWIEGLDRI